MSKSNPIPRILLEDTLERTRLLEKVNSLVDQSVGKYDCWEWQGGRQHYGHGRIGVSVYGTTIGLLVHRLTYAWEYGKDPHPLDIDHLCGNPPCVNPLHLQAVTVQTNTLRSDAPSALNAQKDHCAQGHPLYGDNLRVVEGRRRSCRICDAAKSKRWREKVDYGHGGAGTRTFKRHGNDKTHCVNGHLWVDENILVRRDGRRECRVCHREQERARQRRLRDIDR